MRESLATLRLPGLRRLASALTLAELGDSLASVALAVVIFGRSGSILATGAFFVASRLGPALVSQPLAAFLDRRKGRRAVGGFYLMEAVLLALLALPLPIPVLILVPIASGAIAVAARSVTRAEAVVRLSHADVLRAGNGALNIGFALAATLGAAVGGVLCGLISPAVPLLLASACFVVGAALSTTVPRARPSGGSTSTLAHLREGLRHARGDRGVIFLIAIQTAALIGFTLVIPIEVVYAERDLGAGPAGYGALLAAWGLGILLGGALFTRVRTPLTLLAGASTLLIAGAYLGLAVAPGLWSACLLSLVGGTGNGMQWVAVMTSLQERVPDALQVRVVGLLDAGAQLAPGVGFVLGTVLTAALSPRTTYALAGCATLAAGAAFLVMYERARSVRSAATQPA